ncbi:Tetratricopeptide repeat-containing protein [Reichenbachiella faecimaris]|uniref:Tetratricopeptide repeat-containing protein n=1 Tax=Reichenbachiella faecimaris TaxID=692418 RepID=A0A1W2G9M4_REIFA|nr:tetratricopeptide repeat protein [Reichenbachiella faecimaris]SMD33172.1 Tetratricopeptide repeat-containing protein [Reichenbachiella faecimaris]
MLKYFGLLGVLSLITISQGFSQNTTKDSLLNELQQNLDNYSRASVYLRLAKGSFSDSSATLQYLDSVERFTPKDKMELTVESSIARGQLYSQFLLFEKSNSYYKNAAAVSARQGFSKLSAKVNFLLAYNYSTTSNVDLAKASFLTAKLYAEKAKDTLVISMILNNLGYLLENEGRLDSSIYYYVLATKFLNEENHKDQLAQGYNNIGYVYQTQQENELALEYFKKGYDLAKQSTGVRPLVYANITLGDYFSELGQYDSALFYLEKALKIRQEKNFVEADYYLFVSLGHVYLNKNDFSKSEEFFLQALDIFIRVEDEQGIADARYNLARIKFHFNQLDEAQASATAALQIAKELKDRTLVADIYDLQSQIYEKLGRYTQAFNALKSHVEIFKEVNQENKSKQIAEIQTKYETEKKEAEIATLSQQATIQNLELEQKNLAILIGGVMVLLIGGFVFFNNRQKSMKTQQSQMELEQRFLRSQLNPHFISNALLAVQNFMLKNQSETAVTYLSKFAKLMRETLENSRKEFIPLEDELEMLTNFMDVHKMRLNNSFEYEIHVSDQIDPEVDTIPPMFVQPFVENAIEHGITPSDGKGKIELKFEKEEEYISIVIKDNGGGYIQSTTASKDHQSLSTTIIRERMEVFNKTLKRKIQLILADVKGADGKTLGAQVELKVPYRYI